MSYEDKNFKRFASDSFFIGKGAFGDVYGPCDWKGKKCAVKKRWLKEDSEKKTEEKDKEKQVSACLRWMALHHPHLIKVYDISLEHPAIYILMEYACGGSLKDVLSKCKSDLPLDILKDWGFQIAEGMAHLHKAEIIHRDLKSPNSEYDSTNTHYYNDYDNGNDAGISSGGWGGRINDINCSSDFGCSTDYHSNGNCKNNNY